MTGVHYVLTTSIIVFIYDQITTHKGSLSFDPKRKEGNVLFNNTLNTFYLQLYGVGHMVNDHSNSKRKHAAATWTTLSN